MALPDRDQQIISAHAGFICQVVALSQNPQHQAELKQLLDSAAQHGWSALVGAVRDIAKGRRDEAVYRGLDEEDRVIAEAILRGMQNPASLPDPKQKPDSTLAAPGLAHMIHAAASNPQALILLGNMAEQMQKAGGPMAQMARVIRPLVNGERDPDKLRKGLDSKAEQVLLGIIDELKKLDGAP